MAQDLTKGRPFPTLLKFTLPVIGGNLFQLFYTLADTMIVGRTLGSNALAAVGSTTIIIYLVLCFIQGITSGFGICLGQRCGAGDEKAMRQSVAVSFVLSAAFTVLITVVCCLLAHPILHWMQTPDSIYDMAYDYMFAVLLGTGATIFYNLISNIFRALGDSRTPVVFLALASLLNIALDIVSIRLLDMNVEGPALATVISQGVSGVICLFYMWKKYPVLRGTREEWKPELSYMKRLCLIGIPMGLQYSVTAIGTLVVQAAVNGLGAAVVAGVTAAQKINAFISCPVEALGQTMAPYTGQNMGAGKLDRIGKGLLSASLIGFGASLICFLIALLGGRQLTLLFVDAAEAQIIEYSYEFLLFCTGGYCLLTLVNTVRFTIQGMGFSIFAIVSGVMEMIARILASAVLVPFLGYAAICMAHPMAWIFADIFLIPAFFWCRQQIGKKRCM